MFIHLIKDEHGSWLKKESEIQQAATQFFPRALSAEQTQESDDGSLL